VTPVAVAVALALLVTVIVNEAAPPRATDAVEVVFVIESDAVQPVTVTVAGVLVEPEPPFVEVNAALLSNEPQVLPTFAVNVTEAVWPGARLQVPKVRLVSPAAGFVVAVRVPVPPAAPVEAYVKPDGRVSVIWIPVAVRVALALFVTVIVYVAAPPTATDAVEVLFVIESVAKGWIAAGWMLRSWLPTEYVVVVPPTVCAPLRTRMWTGAPLMLLIPPWPFAGGERTPQ
jgi:hypothetical protein